MFILFPKIYEVKITMCYLFTRYKFLRQATQVQELRHYLQLTLYYLNKFSYSALILVVYKNILGCGLSEGEYISLGYYEKDDLSVVIKYLRESGKVSTIGLWGRSMGGKYFNSLYH